MLRNFFLFFLLFAYPVLSVKSLEVTITQGSIEPSPIAITDFYSNDNKNIKIGKNISTVISCICTMYVYTWLLRIQMQTS